MAIWSLVIGIPLFVLISMGIILGDRFMQQEKTSSTASAVLRPIQERL
jgi:hypothetical protein